MTRLPSNTTTLRALCALIFCLLAAAGAAAQTCSTATTAVSGTFGGGGTGSAPMTQTMTATGTVSGSNLVVTVTYDLTPTTAGTITRLDVVFGPGYVSTVQTSTSSNNITYNAGTATQTSYAPSSFVRLPTTLLGGGTVRAQGTITIPLGSVTVINGKLTLAPMINGTMDTTSPNRFSVSNNTFIVPTDDNDSQGVCISGYCQTVNSYTASATTINAGQSTTLSYSLSGATSATITDLSTGVATSVPVQSGTLVVTPASTRTYRLTANGPCAAVTRDVTITVNQPPSITSFTGTSPVCAGDSSTLTWTSTGGTSATITDLSTATVTSVAVNGSRTVTPATTRTYRLTVTNAVGTDTQDVTITVTPLAAINTYAATSTNINAGQSVTLSWTTTNATTATITDLSTNVVTNVAVNGSRVFTPATTRTYRLTATSSCGSVTRDITITVLQPPTANTFTSPSPVCAGSATTQNWTSTGATSATITDLSTGVATSVAVNGTRNVTPASTRSYRLTVTNAAGSDTLDVSVTVTPLAVINTYSATSTTINAGASTTLSWTTTNATSATVTDLSTGTVTAVAVDGSRTVTPATTRTYRLTATSSCGSVTQDITITVNPPTVDSLTASANPVCAGASTTISWTSTGATSATLTDLATGTATAVPVDGSRTVTPATSRTYRLAVTNSAGTTSQDIPITVTPLAAADSFSASATTINAGQSTTLSYSVSNTTSRTITDLSTGTITNLPAQSGTLAVTPATSRTYRLTATSSCGTDTRDLTITVNQPPSITSFTGTSPVCAGDSSTLSWATTGATSATITDLTAATVTSVPVNGTLAVTPASTRNYRLTVTNAAGSTTQVFNVTVTPLAAVNTFSTSPGTINLGASATLSWTTTNATSVTITDLSTAAVTTVPVDGSLAVTPATTRTYRLTASGSCNTVTRDVTVTVRQPPTVDAFAGASPVCAGDSSTLTWTSTGATSATLTDLATGTATAVPVDGSRTVTPASTNTYRLAVTNAAGTDTRDFTVTVTPTPAINTYSASSTGINAGQSVTLSWTTANTATRTITDLSTGTVTNLTNQSGSRVFTPATTRTYRLTATSSCGSVTQDITITVLQAPTISAFAGTTPVCAGAASTLSWTAAGGSSATISAPGLPGSPVSVNPNSGTLVVNPNTTTTYTLAVTNAAGTDTQAATVTVTPNPAVSTFTATPASIVQGQSVTLSWTTTNGTSATVTDLSTGTATAVAVNSSMVVTPAATRTYRLTLSGTCGTVTRDVTVTVTACQTVSTYSASSTTINQGQSTTLSYTLTGATSATITDLSTGVTTSVPVQSGSLVVTPASTRTYRLTANGPCAAVTRDLTITVNGTPVIVSFTSSAPSVCPGGNVTLSWSGTNGTSATISAPGLPGSPVSVNPAGGTLAVTPSAPSTTYTLTLNGAGGQTVSQQVTVTVTPTPAINTYSASSTGINAGQSVTLSYTSSNATGATITDLSTGAVTTGTVPNGSYTFSPATTRTYRLTLSGTCGSVTRDITITVTPCQTVGTFSASATTINQGDSTVLSYSLSGATAATITDLSTGVVTTVPVQSGTLTVSPASTRTYRLSAAGPCAAVTRNLTITVNSASGSALLGPAGQPDASGATSTNDDYTNMTVLTGVAVPPGGFTTASSSRVFTNTLRNPQAVQADTYTLTAPAIPAGFTAEVSTDGGSSYVSLNGGASTTVTVAAGADLDLRVRVTAPVGVAVLAGYAVVIRATSGLTPAEFNETIDRLWTGFVRAIKTATVTNETGVGGPTDAVPGARIEYGVTYTNVTPAPAGSGNVDLTATNLVLTENGLAAPNNWGLTTNHVAGSASDSRGGAITGDVPGSTLLTDTVPSLAPTESGVFTFRRVIR